MAKFARYSIGRAGALLLLTALLAAGGCAGMQSDATPRSDSKDGTGEEQAVQDKDRPLTPEKILASIPVPLSPLKGESSIMNPPVLSWRGIPGAEAYDVEIILPDGSADLRRVEGRKGIVAEILAEEALDLGATVRWRIRVSHRGETGSWSDIIEFVIGDVDLGFVEVLARGQEAPFEMGNPQGEADEAPLRSITLTRPLLMMQRELTNAQAVVLLNAAIRRGKVFLRSSGVFAADGETLVLGLEGLDYGEQFGVAAAEQSGEGLVVVGGRDNHPVVGISWYGAILLANFVGEIYGYSPVYSGNADPQWNSEVRGVRLPTEAEWEYAGRMPDGRPYPWGSASPFGRANFYRSGDGFESVTPPFTQAGGPTTPVGFFPRGRSASGLDDLIGNVWEWCWDAYDLSSYESTPNSLRDPTGPANPPTNRFGVVERVVRGGAWNSRVETISLTNRGQFDPAGASYSIGIRLAREP